MKKIINIKWIYVFAVALTFTFCTDFDDLNTDPTESSDLDPNLQIPTVQILQSNQADNLHRIFIYPGGFMNQWTNDWAVIEYGGRGAKNSAYFYDIWNMYNSGIISNVVDLVERTRDVPEYTNIHAIGRILKVQIFLRMTDLYGDIPYSEAGLGYYQGIFMPKYDEQKDIYDDFFKELKEAVASFTTSQPLATADLYYNGNIEKWKKYANSLRLRIALRLVKVDPERARTEAQLAVNDGVFTSNADICRVQHDNVQEDVGASAGNGVANILLRSNTNFRLTTEMIDPMEKMKDPRITLYGGSYLDDNNRTDITPQVYTHYGTYKQMTMGAQLFSYDEEVQTAAITIEVDGREVEVERLYQFLQPSKLITNPGSPYIHMSYAEVEFLLAECVVRGYISGDAASHYKKGLEAAVRQWSLFGAEVQESRVLEFSANNPLKSGDELNQINTQLWILHFLDPAETWSNWRRSGLPDIKFYNYRPALNETGGKTPRRLQYPVDEQNNNYANWKAAVDRLGGSDNWMARMWWDRE